MKKLKIHHFKRIKIKIKINKPQYRKDYSKSNGRNEAHVLIDDVFIVINNVIRQLVETVDVWKLFRT